MIPHMLSNTPDFLEWSKQYRFVRAFKSMDQAQFFINGNFYCSHICKNHIMNDQREDKNEGIAYIFKPFHTNTYQTIQPLFHSPIITISNPAIRQGDLIQYSYHMNALNLCVGLVKYLPICGKMYERYKGFGNYWVIGEFYDLLQSVQNIPDWVVAYKVLYSNELIGNWVKRTDYEDEHEFKFLFNNSHNISETAAYIYKTDPLTSSQIIELRQYES